MTNLYDLIYNFFETNIFTSQNQTINDVVFSIGGNSTPLTMLNWLNHTMTIITLLLLVFFLYIFVKWIFKLFAGLLYR